MTRAKLGLARLLGRGFIAFFALVLTAAAVVDAYVYPFMRGLENRSYDFILRNRIMVEKPSENIVILDIDEASLAAMASEYGRWPWPRAVLGEMLDELERQGARAIFFDILFADPDVQNAGSDRAFDDAVKRSKHSYFATLRLDHSRDSKSELHASRVPGAARIGATGADPTIAMIVPRFPAILASARVGTANASPDSDSVVRRAVLYEDAGAWRIPSVPLVLARALLSGVPADREIRLNWRGAPFSYRFISFAEVHTDLLRKNRQRDPQEFTGKIVLIGSTAPALFDLRATPMASAHPGVEILATALDNLQRGDYYRRVDRTVSLAVSLLLIWGLYLGMRWMSRSAETGALMVAVQILLLVIAYLSLNFTYYYIDLVGSAAFGLVFFVVVNLRTRLRESAARDGDALLLHLDRSQPCQLYHLRIEAQDGTLQPRTHAWLVDAVCRSRAHARLADPPFEDIDLLGGDYAGMSIVYWLAAANSEDQSRAARVERDRFAQEVNHREGARARLELGDTLIASLEARSGRIAGIGRVLLGAYQNSGRLQP